MIGKKSTRTLSRNSKQVLEYLKTIRDDPGRFTDFLIMHEIFISTPEMMDVLFLVVKYDEFCLDHPFTFTLQSSTHNFERKDARKLYNRIKKENKEDSVMFRKAWVDNSIQSTYHINDRYVDDCQILRRSSATSRISKRLSTNFVGKTSSSVIATKILHDSLRGSFKNILELMRQPESSFLLSVKNLKDRLISSALTYIDRRCFQKLHLKDLASLNRGEKSPKIAKLMGEQQEKVKELFETELKATDNPRIALLTALRICKHLKKQKNYHSLFTVLLAINNVPKEYWDYILAEKRLFFRQMMSIYDPARAYKNYRMYADTPTEPIIVCFPIFSRDMFLFFEHNEKWLEEDERERATLINEEFIHNIAKRYQIAKSAGKVKIQGKIDENIVESLTFVDTNDLD